MSTIIDGYNSRNRSGFSVVTNPHKANFYARNHALVTSISTDYEIRYA
jgi:hypothetical protein